MRYDYEKNKEYQKDYQKTSQKAKEARKRYYEKNKGRWKEYSRKYRANPEKRLRAIIHVAKNRANAKGLEFDITLEHFLSQGLPAKCPVLGIDIDYLATLNCPNAISLDRKDNNKGYTKENTRLISLRANTLKSDATIEEMKKILEYMSNYTN